ncbi:UNVERIFIED_ORG: serine/threonine protein kinase [Actinomadura viridilutea]|nr:serine/threonine-protein kinase [Actinomadura rubrobrunea]
MTDRRVADRYRLLAPLGEGGMGTVWRARDEVLGRDVAVKQLEPPEDVPPDEHAVLRERAWREARALAMLEHPGVITVHDVVQVDGDPWIVMELVDGRSLAQVIEADGPLPPRRVAEIGLRLLEALACVHERGLLHRDVKPSNVLLAADGRVVLTDFGLVVMDGDPALTRTGALVGSAGFIAPERLRDEPYGPPSDLWSLGATLYAAVEGRGPFDRDETVASLGAVLTEDAPRPRRSGPLGPVLGHLLVKDPAARIGTEEAMAALRRVAAGGRSGLSRPGPSRVRRAVRIGGPALVGAVALAVAAPILVDGADRPGGVPATPRAAPKSAPLTACSLLTDAEARSLAAGAVRRPDTPLKGQCSWLARDVPAEIVVYVPRQAESADAARKRMAVRRNEMISGFTGGGSPITLTWEDAGVDKMKAVSTEPRVVTGVGDEAVVHGYRGTSHPIDMVTVLMRKDDVMVEVTFQARRDGPVAPEEGARRAASMIAAAIARRGRPS